MRFTLDSASEVSGDEQPSPVVVRKPLPPRTDLTNFASSSSAPTPSRRGILRNTPSYTAATPTPQRVQRFQDEVPHRRASPQLKERDSTPGRRGADEAPQPSFQQQNRRRSATPAFELVGVASSSSRAPITSGTDVSSPAAHRTAPQRPPGILPPWMRPSFNRAPRTNIDGYALDSSDDEDAALSSSNDEDEARPSDSDSDLDGNGDSDNAGSSSSQTSPYDEEITDSEDEVWPADPGATSRAQRTGKSKSRAGTNRASASAVKLASVAGDDWEEWNRASSRLAWHRARTARRHGPVAANGRAASQRPPSKSASTPGKDVDEVLALLSSLNMRRDEEDAQIKKAFEARNKDLWYGIDACILAAETEARQAAAAEAARLEAARKTQEEAERKAAQLRQAEMDRIEAEKKVAAAEAERRKQEAEAQAAKLKQDEAEQAKARAMGGSGDDIRRAALAEYDEWMAKIRHIKNNVLPSISSNPDLRKQCFAAKRQITPKIGQLTNSRQEIVRITQAIATVLDAAKQAAASGGGDVYTWILNHLSKCLIRQAEQEVAAKQDTAYPLARVVVWLVLLGHVDLADVLMARLCKKCPWIVPVWPPRTKDMDEAAYRKVMGYKSSDETTENYSNRMNGIAAFYFAILQTVPTPPPGQSGLQLDRVPLHLRSTSMWRWSVRALTPSASTSSFAFLDHPMCPSVWSVFIEIAGPYALKLYGKQMRKLLALLLTQGLQAKKAGWLQHAADKPYVKAATVRLELLLTDWQASPGQALIQNATKGVDMDP